jgi:anti-sigma B factor antagonist
MEMQSELKEQILVIYLTGHLLGAQANTVVMGLVFQNIEAGNKKVIFNLKGVNYVDSAGLGMLLSAVSKIKNAGGQLVICNLSEQVVKLLKTTKVESVFRISPDEEGAIQFLKALN